MVALRPYQLECIETVWRDLFQQENVLVQAATGAGKTLTFAHLIRRVLELVPGSRVLVLMGRVDLVAQTERALHAVLERRDVGVYCGSLNRKEISRPVTVASIHSLGDLRQVPPFQMLVVDECHNLDQEKGKYIKFIDRLRERNPKLKLVGFTATPFRSDGLIYGEGKLFPRLSFARNIQDMIAMGYLCRPVLKAVEHALDTSELHTRAGEYVQEEVAALVSDDEVLRAQIREGLTKLAGRGCVAWACANISHAERVKKMLEQEAESAAIVHSELADCTRKLELKRFVGGNARHMVFVSILSEGFDHPPIDAIVLMRPTRSPVLYVQTVGRGLRLYGDKRDCLVLDFGQVVRELGPLDDPKVKGAKGEGEAVMKECPNCSSYVFGGSRACPDCSFLFPPPATPEQSLTKRADHTAAILSEDRAPITEEVGPAIVQMYESKAGNLCVKVVYSYGALKNAWGSYDGIAEFYAVKSQWAMQRLEQRLGLLGVELPGVPFQGELRGRGTFEIQKAKDEKNPKYWRVVSVRRVSDENPEGTDEPEPDTSFDFGFNASEEEETVPW